jgi:hypothetical protein
VEERPREASGSVQVRPGAGLGRPSRAGRRLTTSGLVAEEAVQGPGTGRAATGRKAAWA